METSRQQSAEKESGLEMSAGVIDVREVLQARTVSGKQGDWDPHTQPVTLPAMQQAAGSRMPVPSHKPPHLLPTAEKFYKLSFPAFCKHFKGI